MKHRHKRPAHLNPPEYLSPSPPLPAPAEAPASAPPHGDKARLDPVRYGDWEKNGIAIDF